MNTKNWLYPFVLIISVVMIIIAVFLPFFSIVVKSGSGTTDTGFGLFENWSENLIFGLNGFESVFAIFVIIGFFIALIGLIGSLVVTLIKLTSSKKFNFKMWNTISALVALLGAIVFAVFAGLFTFSNVVGDSSAYVKIASTTGVYVSIAGMLIGIIASFMGANDLHPTTKKVKQAESKSK